MSGDRAVLGLRGALADEDLLSHEPLAASSAAGSGHTQRPPGPQTGRQLAPQRSSALHVQRLVDRLMRDPHRLIIREIDPQAGRDLLGAPRPRPAAIRAAAVTPADPAYPWTRDRGPVRPLDHAGETVLDVASQLFVAGELRGLRTLGAPISVPLRSRDAVLKTAAARGGIAAQLARDRRG